MIKIFSIYLLFKEYWTKEKQIFKKSGKILNHYFPIATNFNEISMVYIFLVKVSLVVTNSHEQKTNSKYEYQIKEKKITYFLIFLKILYLKTLWFGLLGFIVT